MTAPIHRFGDTSPLAWPQGAVHVFAVRYWGGRYIATYASRGDAERAADHRLLGTRYSGVVEQVSRSD